MILYLVRAKYKMSASLCEVVEQKRSFHSEETSATAGVTIGLQKQRRSVDWTKELFTVLFSRLNIKIVEFVLDNGAELDTPDFYGYTPLHRALNIGNIEAVELFINRGADVNNTNNKIKITPFYYAVGNGNIKLIELFIKHGADVNTVSYIDKETPLHRASSALNLKVIKLLLKRGATLDNGDSYGKTPFNHAEDRYNFDAMRLLLDRGSDVDNVDISGRTALHRASQFGHVGMVRFFIGRGG